MRFASTFLLCTLCLFFSLSGALANELYTSDPYRQRQEVISDFQSRITINRDASVNITEVITAKNTGVTIRHGIYRDFPLFYLDQFGQRHDIDLQITQALRDNRPIRYSVENQGTSRRVSLGSQDTILSPDTYTFTLSYKIDDQVGFFPDYDQLYWNITGNDWNLPIERASAVVALPTNGQISKALGYTGRLGERGDHFTTKQSGKNAVLYATTHILKPGEGLTVAVAWPKGLIEKPDFIHKVTTFFTRHILLLVLVVFLLIHLLLLIIAKYMSSQAVIVPRFEPPKNMSPAMMNYAMTMFSDGGSKAFAATLVDMAVKKYIRIYEKNGKFCLVKLSDRTDKLDPYEKPLAKKLFDCESEVPINDDNRNILSDAFTRMRSDITRDHGVTKDKNTPSSIITLVHWTLSGLVAAIFVVHEIDIEIVSLGLIMFSFLFKRLLNGQISSSFTNDTISQIEGFKMYLSTAEKGRLNAHAKEATIDSSLFEKYLPYAIALGVADAWSKKFSPIFAENLVASGVVGSADGYVPDWYGSDSLSNDLSSSFGSFGTMINSLSETLTSTINDIFTTSIGDSGFGDGFAGDSGSGGGGGSSGGGGF